MLIHHHHLDSLLLHHKARIYEYSAVLTPSIEIHWSDTLPYTNILKIISQLDDLYHLWSWIILYT